MKKVLQCLLILFSLTTISCNQKKIKSPPEPTLIKVEMHINVADGIDHNSNVTFNLYHSTESDIVATTTERNVNSNIGIDKELTIVNSQFEKSMMNQTTFYMEIHGVGHDSFNGNISLTFTYSDNSKNAFYYGNFSIGTHRESHTTRKKISGL